MSRTKLKISLSKLVYQMANYASIILSDFFHINTTNSYRCLMADQNDNENIETKSVEIGAKIPFEEL
jgi:hypothetical protein